MVRKPPSLSSVSTSDSKSSSTYPPSVLSNSWDADDESDIMDMSAEDCGLPPALHAGAPKTGSIHGPFCPRRPNLREILANTAEAPWTLAAFMAYLSNNHCLETLEFTMDAGRYKKHFAKMMAKAGPGGLPSSKDREYVQQLWERLVEAYIQPSGSREVNIPSMVRDPILRLQADTLPPAPEALDPAVAKIYELMEDSLLVPFLNSVYPHSTSPTIAQHSSRESVAESTHAYDHRFDRRVASRNSPPPQSAAPSNSRSYSPSSTLHRKSALMAYLPAAKAYGSRLSHATSNPARSSMGDLDAMASRSDVNVSGPGMTDDSASADSPANDSPATPPTTPPLSDSHSLNTKRDSGMWKKLGRLSGMKTSRKRSEGKLREEQ